MCLKSIFVGIAYCLCRFFPNSTIQIRRYPTRRGYSDRMKSANIRPLFGVQFASLSILITTVFFVLSREMKEEKKNYDNRAVFFFVLAFK